MIFSKKRPKKLTIFVHIKSSVETKKGKRAGTTEFAQRESPDLTADKLLLEKINMLIVNKRKIIAMIFLFKRKK